MSENRRDDGEPPPEVAEHMAEAVSYLSMVAKKAGFKSISSDLLAIRRKLRAKTRPAAGGSAPASTRTVKRSI